MEGNYERIVFTTSCLEVLAILDRGGVEMDHVYERPRLEEPVACLAKGAGFVFDRKGYDWRNLKESPPETAQTLVTLNTTSSIYQFVRAVLANPI